MYGWTCAKWQARKRLPSISMLAGLPKQWTYQLFSHLLWEHFFTYIPGSKPRWIQKEPLNSYLPGRYPTELVNILAIQGYTSCQLAGASSLSQHGHVGRCSWRIPGGPHIPSLWLSIGQWGWKGGTDQVAPSGINKFYLGISFVDCNLPHQMQVQKDSSVLREESLVWPESYY